ncbi:MAG: HDIG domain-containing protein [Candidatus Sericytochromatia bacterium]|nr:HDIG domain-containing protein [Candidatus Sericytochromatia bacterium]
MSIVENENQLLENISKLEPIKPVKRNILASHLLHKSLIFIVSFVSIFFIYALSPGQSNHYFKDGGLSYIGLGLYLMIVMTLFTLFLKKFWVSYISSIRHLALMSFLTIFTILFNELTFSFSPYFSFLPAFAMLIRIFTNFQVSLVLSIAVTISSYMLSSNDVTVLAINLFSVVLSSFSLTKIQQRSDLAKAGLTVSFVDSIILVSLKLITGATDLNKLMLDVSLVAASGVFSAIISIGSLPYLESLFGLITSFKLAELTNPNQPLLKQMMIKAPGTYQHSLIVGNLAEAAAEGINADALLTRVGAMYHDIGKMVRPYFFIENQLGIENQHSKISPRLSALVITSHVKEGIELAKEYKLPSIIRDFIPMHHGTSLVAYFYHQAKQTEKSEDVVEAHFRYPGPKPQTKETAILMLADATEAAVRAISKPTVDQIQKTIGKIIKARIDDGQLAEAPLTLVDLEKISNEFLRILQSLYHSRIEYPSEEKIMKDLGRKPQNGNIFK